jgi:hypothetical protein
VYLLACLQQQAGPSEKSKPNAHFAPFSSHSLTHHSHIYIMAEKYTQWADKSCGVNPFVPGEIPLPKQTLMRVGRYLAASLMFLPRMVISFTLILLYCLVQIVLNEMLLLLVSFGLSWLCNTGKIEAKYFTPLVVLLVINLLSVMNFEHVFHG